MVVSCKELFVVVYCFFMLVVVMFLIVYGILKTGDKFWIQSVGASSGLCSRGLLLTRQPLCWAELSGRSLIVIAVV